MKAGKTGRNEGARGRGKTAVPHGPYLEVRLEPEISGKSWKGVGMGEVILLAYTSTASRQLEG